MNIISWNYRGTASKGFSFIIKDLVYRYHANLIFLLETHISGHKAEATIKNLGFDSWCISDADGFAGGIWCLWNKSLWNIEPEIIEKQFVHLKVRYKQEKPWWLTAIYGSPHVKNRSSLWNKLEELAMGINGPWCLGGDFNSVATLDDTGGNSNLSQDTNRFISCMRNCNLNSLDFSGPPYTWQRGKVKRRLDRFICNINFCSLFPTEGVRHLPKLKSDHLPLLLDFNISTVQGGERPFRLLAPWLIHEDYNNLVAQS
ncbi:hypothetical protein AHAS_Ahas17G0079500 [Arachis hypogaea]